jgi:hypothetical protein
MPSRYYRRVSLQNTAAQHFGHNARLSAAKGTRCGRNNREADHDWHRSSNADSDTVNVKLPAAAKHMAREHPDFQVGALADCGHRSRISLGNSCFTFSISPSLTWLDRCVTSPAALTPSRSRS